jgi:succinate dehydrogenase / fumarate reductase cytochrome b subunit
MPPKPRPLSPHIQVYNMWKITSLTSILHRITGIGLVIGTFVLAWWLVAIAMGPKAYECFLSVAQSWFGQLALLGLTWAFCYHLCSGMRHLIWDAGIGLKIETARKSGVVVLGASFALTAIIWMWIFLI